MLCFTLAASASWAEEIHVAVASNFAVALRQIATRFEDATQHEVVLSSGSTGKHYAQIRNGAPFDVFFAADAKRPQRLVQDGWALPNSRFTYAIGKLVLWSPSVDYVDEHGRILEAGVYRYLAIANPKTAPYGAAAREVLAAKGLWANLQPRLVRGENIAQTYQFVVSRNAELGFVAWSQIQPSAGSESGSYWVVDPALYRPIEQQVVLLVRGKDKLAARQFLDYVKGGQAREIIERFGYALPRSQAE